MEFRAGARGDQSCPIVRHTPRGRDFGQSRLICDAQWQSDVDAGEQVGTLVVARLRRDKTFLADLQSAKVEVAHVLATTAKPPAGCGKMAIAAR